MSAWNPESWRRYPAEQQPPYSNPDLLKSVLHRLGQMPALVSAGEVEHLKRELAEAAAGKRFILQGGDCAERFVDCTGESIQRKLKILLQMSLVLTYGGRRPVTRIGRLAGQFAKPRSQATELVGGRELPVFRGDNINDLSPDEQLRQPDPLRLERGYFYSAATLNYVRALLKGGFASLDAPEHWQMDFIPEGSNYTEYHHIAERIRDAINYLKSLGSDAPFWHEVDIFTSHEGLLLGYEEALTRKDEDSGRPYNLGAHFLWIGERTRQLEGAHVEYFRGLANPIGLKVGPSMKPDELLALIRRLNPEREPGKLMIITRFGHARIAQCLPPLLRAVREAGEPVVWSCDPMHGNTSVLQGLKTRDFQHIATELIQAFDIHRDQGSYLAGVHFELTGDNVTECVGGAQGLSADDLSRSYETGCDPRLNYAQSLEMAFTMTRMLPRLGKP